MISFLFNYGLIILVVIIIVNWWLRKNGYKTPNWLFGEDKGKDKWSRYHQTKAVKKKK